MAGGGGVIRAHRGHCGCLAEGLEFSLWPLRAPWERGAGHEDTRPHGAWAEAGQPAKGPERGGAEP